MGSVRKFDYAVAGRMYLDGLRPVQIGLLLGVSARAVEFALRRQGLALKDRGRATYEKWAEILTAQQPDAAIESTRSTVLPAVQETRLSTG